MNKEFTVVHRRQITVREGWGVEIVPLWGEREDGSEYVSEIETDVVRVAPDTIVYSSSDGVPCVQTASNFFVPVENFKDLPDLDTDDTHDLRTRWFATEYEARDHAEYTKSRFANPQPWESFVKL